MNFVFVPFFTYVKRIKILPWNIVKIDHESKRNNLYQLKNKEKKYAHDKISFFV